MCVCVGMSVVSKMRRRNDVAHAKVIFVKTDRDTRVIHFDYALEQRMDEKETFT